MHNVSDRSVAAGLLRGAAFALAIQLVATTVGYALEIALARWLGPAGYGTYAFVVGWIGPLTVVAALGLPTSVLRFLPEYEQRGDEARAHGFVRYSERLVLTVGGLLALGASAVVLVSGAGGEEQSVLLVGLWTVPLAVLLRLQTETARAIRRFGLALALPVLRPLLMLVMAFLVIVLAGRLRPMDVLLAMAAALAVVVVVQRIRLRPHLGRTSRRSLAAYEPRTWLAVSFPLLLVEAFVVVLNQTDVLVLGLLGGVQEVALYQAATSTVSLLAFVLIAVGAVGAPMIAAAATAGRPEDLQRISEAFVRWTFFPTFALAVVLVMFSAPLLDLFGSGFAGAKPVLLVLVAGQLVNIGAGAVGHLTNLTGQQATAARIFAVAAVVNLVLNFVLIPPFGALGAATATAVSMAAWNLLLHRVVVRRVGVRPSVRSTLPQLGAGGRVIEALRALGS